MNSLTICVEPNWKKLRLHRMLDSPMLQVALALFANLTIRGR
jgi:hypothetical protein